MELFLMRFYDQNNIFKYKIMNSIFTKIIRGEIPSYKVAEDDKHVAFLDAMPIAKGHTLVVPKQEIDLIFDLENEDFKEFWSFAQKVAKKMGRTYSDKRIAVAVIGLEVPHAHIHLVPISKTEDMNFKNVRLKFSDEEYREIQTSIQTS
jgi:histidine triad (HIT) family protein